MANRQREDTVLEAKKAKVKAPPMFKVMLLNDDYTPMDFVVLVLQKFFAMTRERATQVMLKVHREGVGVTGRQRRIVECAGEGHACLHAELGAEGRRLVSRQARAGGGRRAAPRPARRSSRRPGS